MIGELYPGEFEAMEHNGRMDALEQEPCDDWHDVPSSEMTLDQARQAVKDLRKKLAEYLEQEICDDAISRQAVINLIRGCNSALEEPRIFDTHNSGTIFEHYITELPPVNPQPKTGHWVDIDEEPHEVWECDHCGFVIDGSGCIDPYDYRDTYKFCPNCGAMMVESQ